MPSCLPLAEPHSAVCRSTLRHHVHLCSKQHHSQVQYRQEYVKMLALAWWLVLLGSRQRGNESPTPSATEVKVAQWIHTCAHLQQHDRNLPTWLPRQAWHVSLAEVEQLEPISLTTPVPKFESCRPRLGVAVRLASWLEPTATETCAGDGTGNLAGKRLSYQRYLMLGTI